MKMFITTGMFPHLQSTNIILNEKRYSTIICMLSTANLPWLDFTDVWYDWIVIISQLSTSRWRTHVFKSKSKNIRFLLKSKLTLFFNKKPYIEAGRVRPMSNVTAGITGLAGFCIFPSTLETFTSQLKPILGKQLTEKSTEPVSLDLKNNLHISSLRPSRENILKLTIWRPIAMQDSTRTPRSAKYW